MNIPGLGKSHAKMGIPISEKAKREFCRLLFLLCGMAAGLIFQSCQKTPSSKANPEIPVLADDSLAKSLGPNRAYYLVSREDTFALGFLDRDAQADTAFVWTPEIENDTDSLGNPGYPFGCKDCMCFNRIRFSNGWPELRVENSIHGTVCQVGDLDGDGNAELAFARDWFIGTWRTLILFSLQQKWIPLQQVRISDLDEADFRSRVVQKPDGLYFMGDTLDMEEAVLISTFKKIVFPPNP